MDSRPSSERDRTDRVWPVLDYLRGSQIGPDEGYRSFLAACAAFLILRHAEIQDIERAAVAAFDDKPFAPLFPREASWSELAAVPAKKLTDYLRPVWSRLEKLGGGGLAAQLARIPRAFDPTQCDPEILVAARDAAGEHRLDEPQGRKQLAREFEEHVGAWLRTAKHIGEYATPSGVADLMIDLADPQVGERIYDPCFGIGGLLMRAARRIVEQAVTLPPQGWQSLHDSSIFGVERFPALHLIATARIILAGISSPGLEVGDALERPAPLDRSAEGFHCILANPPLGARREESIANHFRIKSTASEALFLQHILRSLRPGGRAVVVVPDGLLFRTGTDSHLRKILLEEYRVEAVISLATGAFLPYAGIKTSILVISRQPPVDQVWFVGSEVGRQIVGDRSDATARDVLVDAVLTRREDKQPAATITERVEIALDQLGSSEGSSKSNAPRAMTLALLASTPEFTANAPTALRKRVDRALHESRLPKLAWSAPVDRLALRHWELVAKETGEETLEDFLRSFADAVPDARRARLADIAEVLTGVGYDSRSTWDASRDGQLNQGGGTLAEVGSSPASRVPLVRVQDISKGMVGDGTLPRAQQPTQYLNEEGLRRVQPRHYIRQDDLLVTASGTIGKVAVAGHALAGAVPAKSVIVIRPIGNVSANYILRWLQSSPCRKWVEGHAAGATIRHLSARTLRELPIIVLNAALQTKLAHQLKGGETEEAILTALARVGEESHWATLLSNDDTLRDVVRFAENRKALQGTLSRWVARSNEWEERAESEEKTEPLARWLLEWTHATHELLACLEIPPSADRYALLRSTRSEIIEGGSLQDAVEEWVDSTANTSGPEVRSQTLRLTAVLLGEWVAIEQDLLGTVDLSPRVEPPFIDTARECDVTVVLRNRGFLALRNFRAQSGPLPTAPQGPGMRFRVETRALLPGGEVALHLVVPPQEAGALPIVVEWTADRLDGQEVSGSLQVALEARSVRAVASGADLGPSPYIVGTPIDRSDMFYGRDDVLAEIKRTLRSDGPSTVILLEGNRRTGKSSILKQLLHPGVLEGWLPVYCSFQSVEGDESVAGMKTRDVFYAIARELILAVHATGSPADIPGVERIDRSVSRLKVRSILSSQLRPLFNVENVFDQFQIALEAALGAAAPQRVLLMLDEFDKLQEGIESGVTSPQLPENIRYVFQNYNQLSGILTGSRRIKRLREEYWSALFGFGIAINVSVLDEAAARALVMKPVEGRLVFAPSACDRVLELTARHPFLIQSLCHRIFEICAETGERSVSVRGVEEAAEVMVEDSEHFRTLWDRLTTDRRRYLTCLVDQLADGPDRITSDLLAARLESDGVPIVDAASIGGDLEQLRELEVLVLEAGEYKVAIPILSRWMRRNVDANMHLQRAIAQGDSDAN